jgi:gliding motility-associated-like protein
MNQFSSLTQKRFMLAKVSKCLVFLFLSLFLFSGSVLAQNTFQVASGNWNNAANWSAGHVPNGTENLVIPSGDVCTMDVSYTGTNTYTLTVSGELSVPSAFSLTMQNATLLMNANGATLSGGGTISLDNLTVNTPGATDEVSITNSNVTPIAIGVGNNTGTINLTNGILKLTGQTLALPKTTAIVVGTGNFANGSDGIVGDVDADGGTLFCATSTPATTTITGAPTFYNVYFSNGNDNFSFDASANAHINGTFTVPNNGNQFHTSGASPIWGTSSTLYYDGGGQNQLLTQSGNLWSSSGPVGTPGYPNNVTITHFGTSGGGGYGWVATNGSVNNIGGVLTIGGIGGASTGIINFSALSTFSCGGFVLESGSKLDAPSTFTVAGSWYDSSAGNYLNNTGTVVFAGAGTQHIGGSVATPFNNVTVNGTGTNILDLPETLASSGVLTMTSGNIQTTSSNILNVTNPNTTGIAGGSSSSYIDGPVNWSMIAGAGTYIVPLGNGGSYLPFTLNKSLSPGATVATIQAFNSAAAASNSVDGTLSSISTTEYWSLATTNALAAGSTVSITRPTAIAPFNSIAESNVQAGPYTSIGGTPYTDSIVNSNNIGTGLLDYFTFGAPPIVSTYNATSITTTTATLQGGFNTQNTSLATGFNWGTTIAYSGGTDVPSLHSPFNSGSVQRLDSLQLTGLTANTLYHYQAEDATPKTGNDVIFITAPNPPTVGVGTAATGNGFTANWTAPAVPGTATYTYTVEASTDPTFATGDSIATGIPSSTTSYTFTTLASGTTYYYRVRADNATASSVWSASSPGISTSISQTVGSCTTGTGSTTSTGAIVESSTLPVIDGAVDNLWNAIPANSISNISVGGSTFTTVPTWKAVWSPDSLYILVQVTDPTLISQNTSLPNSVAVAGATPGTSTNYYDFDGVELTLDPDYSHGTTYDGLNDVQFRFNLGSTALSGQSCGCATQFMGTMFTNVNTHIDYKVVVVPGVGYNVEAAIPWGQNAANPGINLISAPSTYGPITNGKNIGLEVQVNDANSVSGRNSQYSWFNASPNPYQNPSTFAEATLKTCILPPQVIDPTATAITATGATLGATVVSSGDALLTGRGTGYTPSPDNSGTGNPLLEGGTTLGVYSGPARTGLSPQTKYYFTGYATNANNETGVSNVDSFYTLSALPTVQASGLNVSGCGQIILNWTAATFPSVGQATETGYLILRSISPAVPTANGIVTRVAATQSELPAGDTLITTINNGSTITYTDATAQPGVTYNYLLVPFTWDGTVVDSTYNYDTTAAPTTSGNSSGGLSKPFVSVIQPTCASPNGVITVTSPSSGVTYSFDGGSTFGASNTLTTSTAANYSVEVKTTVGGCVSADSVVTIVAPTPPTAPTASATNPTCTVATGSINITQSAGLTYSIDSIHYYPYNDPHFSSLAPGTYYVSAENAGSCISGGTQVIIQPQPTTTTAPAVTPVQPTCTVATGSITITPVAGATYSIDGGANYYTYPNAAFTGLAANNYTVSEELGNCTSSTPVVIDPQPVTPSVTSVTSSADTTDGTVLITLTGTVSNADPSAIYRWTVLPSGTVTTGSSTATATPAVTSTYTLTVTNPGNCSDFADKIVVVVPTTCVVPNAFTPNADGFNDLWVVNGGCFFSVDVNVYNRWGSLVYHAVNYQNDWDGTYQGKQLPDGTYYYVLTIHRLSGGDYTRTGNVTIMR